MVGSRRTPIDRTPRPVLDYESVRMFRRGMKLISEGREGEKEFKKLHLNLHRRLGLKPWHQNVLDLDDSPPAEPHQFVFWKYVASLRDQLVALARPRLVRSEAGDTHQAEPLA